MEKKFKIYRSLDEIFNIFPSYYHHIANKHNLNPYPLNDDKVRVGIGVYLSYVLKKFGTESIKKEKLYPTIIYTEILEKLNKGYTKEDLKYIVEPIIFMDIVYPQWKNNTLWYKKQRYEKTIRRIISLIFDPDLYQYYLSYNYNRAMLCAHIAYEQTLISEGIHLPGSFH